MPPRKPKVEKPTTAEVKSEVATKPPSTTKAASQASAPQNRGQVPRLGRKPKGKPRGPGKPFPKGQPDKLPGKEHRFVKGDPRINRGGRPRELWEIKERIRDRGMDLFEHLLAIADEKPGLLLGSDEGGGKGITVGPEHKDRIAAIRELLAYAYGKPTQAVEVSGPNGEAIRMENAAQSDLLDTLKVMEERIVKGQAPAPKVAEVPTRDPVEAAAVAAVEPEQEEDADGTDPA